VAALGDTVSFEYGGTKGTITLKRVERIQGAQGGMPHTPPVNGSFLLARIRLGISHGPGLASDSAFRAQTPDGRIYHAVSGVVQEPLNGHGGPIESGEHVHGDVAFDVPAGDLVISYAPAGTPLVAFKLAS
jgi:hypothetical protein